MFTDPRTKDWFVLFGSPVPVWIITAIYVIGVTYVGPKFMENRKPYSLQTFMIIYNIGLVFGSLYLFLEVTCTTLVNVSVDLVVFTRIAGTS